MTGLRISAKFLPDLKPLAIIALTGASMIFGANVLAGTFLPPKNLSPLGDNVRLNERFLNEAWLVYTYDIDVNGSVVNAKIHSSNGVPEVEREVLAQITGMVFSPAINDGKPVKVSSDPVVFTWTLDKPRTISRKFKAAYDATDALIKLENFDAAFDQAVKLKAISGRSVYEEVQFQLLASTLAQGWEDEPAEMQHLNRAIELQTIADDQLFENDYIEPQEYGLVLERILTLELSRMMLADAKVTLSKLYDLKVDPKITARAAKRYADVESVHNATAEVLVKGELLPMYRDGPGVWKTRLGRDFFSISDVDGKIDAVFLSCNRGEIQLTFPSPTSWKIPRFWLDCKVDVSGDVDTRFTLHQSVAN